jgi:hypothetical protein
VVTTVVSRDFARMYVKLLKEGSADIPLAPEEAEAVEQAKGSGPFTIRPRIEGASLNEMAPETGSPSIAPDEPMSLGLPGRRPMGDRELARENRRRKRHGLPLVENEVVPSAVGWKEPRTPGPNGDSEQSLADQYLAERKSLRKKFRGEGEMDFDESGPEDRDEL